MKFKDINVMPMNIKEVILERFFISEDCREELYEMTRNFDLRRLTSHDRMLLFMQIDEILDRLHPEMQNRKWENMTVYPKDREEKSFFEYWPEDTNERPNEDRG